VPAPSRPTIDPEFEMTVLTRSLDVPLTAAVVWDTFVRVEAWPRWMAHVIEAGWGRPGSPATPADGAPLWFRFQQNQRSPLVEAEVTAFRPLRELSYRPTGGDAPYFDGIEGVEWQWLIYDRGRACSVRFTLTYETGTGMALVQDLVGTRLQVLNAADSSLQALRAMAEGRPGHSDFGLA
jgi:hypothetical protein